MISKESFFEFPKLQFKSFKFQASIQLLYCSFKKKLKKKKNWNKQKKKIWKQKKIKKTTTKNQELLSRIEIFSYITMVHHDVM